MWLIHFCPSILSHQSVLLKSLDCLPGFSILVTLPPVPPVKCPLCSYLGCPIPPGAQLNGNVKKSDCWHLFDHCTLFYWPPFVMLSCIAATSPQEGHLPIAGLSCNFCPLLYSQISCYLHITDSLSVCSGVLSSPIFSLNNTLVSCQFSYKKSSDPI